MQYSYPTYGTDLSPETLAVCRDVGQRLLEDVGLCIRHEKFVAALRGHEGVRVEGDRVHMNRSLTDRFFDAYIAEKREELIAQDAPSPGADWSLKCNGFSIMVMDVETDDVRPATCQDLRDLIRLVHSFGMSGS